MTDKKKAPQKSGEEDESTANIIKFYRKKCELNGITSVSKLFKEKVDRALEEGNNL
jgi:hypothetical protein